jgi:hypothetical protein
MKMGKITNQRNRVLNAILDRNGKYVRAVDGEGKSLTFIMAEEISIEEKPDFSKKIMDKMRSEEIARRPWGGFPQIP